MADFTTAARPYARAVYQQATETSSVEGWSDALGLMAAVVGDATMVEVLDNPQLGREQKGDLVLQVVGDKLNEQQKNLIKLMAQNGRLKALPELVVQFESYRAEAEGKIDAEVVSAFPLSDEQEKAIVATLKTRFGREITLSTTTDESLIGGVVIKAGDTIIDGSMKSQLESLAMALSR